MRLWTISPTLLDLSRFLALWRESLGILSIVRDPKKKGYRRHPQVRRVFEQDAITPLQFIESYIWYLQQEADRRKIRHKEAVPQCYNAARGEIVKCGQIQVSVGQIDFELYHFGMKIGGSVGIHFYNRMHRLLVEDPNSQVHRLFFIDSTNPKSEKWEKSPTLDAWTALKPDLSGVGSRTA